MAAGQPYKCRCPSQATKIAMKTSPLTHRPQRRLGPSVGVTEAWQRAYWAFELDIDESELIDIIAVAGDRVDDVVSEVKRRRQESA